MMAPAEFNRSGIGIELPAVTRLLSNDLLKDETAEAGCKSGINQLINIKTRRG